MPTFHNVKIKHSNLPDSRFNAKQLKMGIKDELEHTYSRALAKAIAKGHLIQHPRYYTSLKRARL